MTQEWADLGGRRTWDPDQGREIVALIDLHGEVFTISLPVGGRAHRPRKAGQYWRTISADNTHRDCPHMVPKGNFKVDQKHSQIHGALAKGENQLSLLKLVEMVSRLQVLEAPSEP